MTVLKLGFDVALAPCDVRSAKGLLSFDVKAKHFIFVKTKMIVSKTMKGATKKLSILESILTPITLENVYRFSQSIIDARHDHPAKKVVVCSGADPEIVTRCTLMLGGFLILYHDVEMMNLEDIFAPILTTLMPLHGSSDSEDFITVMDCWRALRRASTLKWFEFSNGNADYEHFIDMPEYLHYDSPANGSMHVVVPGRLLVFPCPADLPNDSLWADSADGRHFSAAYFADIFGDFDVHMVVRCGGNEYATTAFEKCDMGIENLLLDFGSGDDSDAAKPNTQGAGMLRAVDRFLTLMRLSPGAVAVHGGGPDGSLGAGGRLLVEAYLIRRYGFSGAEAVAWVLMVHPGAAARAASMITIEDGADWTKRSRSASATGGLAAAAYADECRHSVPDLLGLGPGSTAGATEGRVQAGHQGWFRSLSLTDLA